MRKSLELTLWLQVAVFTHFLEEKWADATTGPPFSGCTMRKSGVALLRRPIPEPLFTTHPSKVGSTTPWTVLAAMLRGPLSHPICRQTIAFCGVLSAIQGGASALQSSPLAAHSKQMCHLNPLADSRDKLHLTRHHPIHAQNFTIRSHSTAQVPHPRRASTCSDVSSRPPCFEMFVMERHTSTISLF